MCVYVLVFICFYVRVCVCVLVGGCLQFAGGEQMQEALDMSPWPTLQQNTVLQGWAAVSGHAGCDVTLTETRPAADWNPALEHEQQDQAQQRETREKDGASERASRDGKHTLLGHIWEVLFLTGCWEARGGVLTHVLTQNCRVYHHHTHTHTHTHNTHTHKG